MKDLLVIQVAYYGSCNRRTKSVSYFACSAFLKFSITEIDLLDIKKKSRNSANKKIQLLTNFGCPEYVQLKKRKMPSKLRAECLRAPKISSSQQRRGTSQPQAKARQRQGKGGPSPSAFGRIYQRVSTVANDVLISRCHSVRIDKNACGCWGRQPGESQSMSGWPQNARHNKWPRKFQDGDALTKLRSPRMWTVINELIAVPDKSGIH